MIYRPATVLRDNLYEEFAAVEGSRVPNLRHTGSPHALEEEDIYRATPPSRLRHLTNFTEDHPRAPELGELRQATATK
jgi:hypothetical protein